MKFRAEIKKNNSKKYLYSLCLTLWGREHTYMKILIAGPLAHNYLDSIINGFDNFGHETVFIKMVEFYKGCSYTERKLHKAGCSFFEKKYNERWMNSFLKKCEMFNPDYILVVNGSMMNINILEKLHLEKYKIGLWLFDSIRRFDKDYEVLLKYYQKIFVFEKNDVVYLKKEYGIKAVYLPVGFDSDIYFCKEERRDIDISFVGNPDENRLRILNRVAKYAEKNFLKMKICGQWYDEKYIWKPWRFKMKNPHLFSYVNNGLISPIRVADLYRRSKICLNLNTAIHKGINPRTFEILATRSFQIMDEREQYSECVRPNIDLVIFKGTEDLINKIEFYLLNSQKRAIIAESGYKWIKNKFSMRNMVERILSEIDAS